jgi:hypothetical protein
MKKLFFISIISCFLSVNVRAQQSTKESFRNAKLPLEIQVYDFIADQPYTIKKEELYKDGQYGYPHAIIYNGYMYVIISRQKGAIEVIRFNLKPLHFEKELTSKPTKKWKGWKCINIKDTRLGGEKISESTYSLKFITNFLISSKRGYRFFLFIPFL